MQAVICFLKLQTIGFQLTESVMVPRSGQGADRRVHGAARRSGTAFGRLCAEELHLRRFIENQDRISRRLSWWDR